MISSIEVVVMTYVDLVNLRRIRSESKITSRGRSEISVAQLQSLRPVLSLLAEAIRWYRLANVS
eukprot:scaffold656623_cov83-Prasinocladus_malaysianus.AAC.1